MKKVLSESVRKPRFTKRGTRPLCRTKCVKTLKAYQKLYFAFKAKFQEISADLRQAIRQGCDTASICFPIGGVPLFGGRYSPDWTEYSVDVVAFWLSGNGKFNSIGDHKQGHSLKL